MSSITFIAILSEMVPAGILGHLSQGLRVSEAKAGQMIGIYALASAICAISLPKVDGEKVTRDNNPFALLRNKAVLMVLLLTLLGVMAHYASYTYITELVNRIQLPGGIEMALILFGVGSFISVMMAMRYTDTALRAFTGIMFAIGGGRAARPLHMAKRGLD